MKFLFILFSITIVSVMGGAAESFCTEKPLGKPEKECGLYGLTVLRKDDRNQRTATMGAEVALVKAGKCYTLFPDVKFGEALFAANGKDISHVTYCGSNKPKPEPTPEDAPEPEVPTTPATCDLVAKPASTCKRLASAREHCTSCVTSACRACRDVFVKHCEHPTPVDSVEACLAQRGGPCRKKKGKKATKCLNGLRRQCEEHICAKQAPLPEDAPEPITPAVPAVCQLTGRNAKTCRKLANAREHCTSCVTSVCKACREVFVKHCENPTPVNSVAACLKARGGPCLKKKGTRAQKCLNGLRRQCEEHVCNRLPEPTPEDAPEPEAVPEPAVCTLQPRSERDCRKLAVAKQHCTSCVTSACKACRKTFEKYCRAPSPVDDVDACLRTRGHEACQHLPQHKRAKCANGLRRQCEEQVCDNVPPTPEDAPEPEAPPVPATCRLEPRSEKDCRKLAVAADHCTSCVTSACKACRRTFERFCREPEVVASVKECLDFRAAFDCNKLPKHKVQRCLNGLRRQCEEHACGGTPPPPKEPECPKQEPDPEVRIIEVRTEGQCYDCIKVKQLETELDLLKKLADKLREEAKKKGIKGLKDDKCMPEATTAPEATTVVGTTNGVGTTVPGATSAGVTTKPEEKTTAPGTTAPGTTAPGTTKPEEKTTVPGATSAGVTSNPPATTAPGGTTPVVETSTPGEVPTPPIRVSESSSSGGANTMLVVGLVVGSAVAAGVAAVAIGMAVGGGAAGAAAPASAAPMGQAATNPLYQANVNSGSNPAFSS